MLLMSEEELVGLLYFHQAGPLAVALSQELACKANVGRTQKRAHGIDSGIIVAWWLLRYPDCCSELGDLCQQHMEGTTWDRAIEVWCSCLSMGLPPPPLPSLHHTLPLLPFPLGNDST